MALGPACVVVGALVLAAAGSAHGRPSGDLGAPLGDARALTGGGLGSPLDEVGALPSGDLGAPTAAVQAVTPHGFDEAAFARALAESRETAGTPLPGARVVVVPHHWPAGKLIVEAMKGVSATRPRGRVSQAGSWQRVVLLGLDHHGAGRLSAMTGDRPWLTPFGTVRPDAAAVMDLARHTGLAAVQPDELAHEHSVAGLVPALAFHLPGARLIPLAARADMRQSQVRDLSDAVTRLADSRTIVIVSVDFAHDLPPARTREMDSESLIALDRLDFDRVMSYGDEHLDGRGAMATAMAVAEALGARRFVPLSRTDGGELWGYGGGNVTSFVSGYYTTAR